MGTLGADTVCVSGREGCSVGALERGGVGTWERGVQSGYLGGRRCSVGTWEGVLRRYLGGGVQRGWVPGREGVQRGYLGGREEV